MRHLGVGALVVRIAFTGTQTLVYDQQEFSFLLIIELELCC